MKVHNRNDGAVSFRCPGCKQTHAVGVGAGPGPRWDYNGDPAAPTFSPSVLVRSGHHVDGDQANCWCAYNAEHPDDPDPFECVICHSFVTNGRIQFLSDCTHALAGQTVDLPDWEFP